jgi:hypothetical protein
MIKYKIHFTVDGVEDSFIVEEATLVLIVIEAKAQSRIRGLEEKKNNMWSEEIKN